MALFGSKKNIDIVPAKKQAKKVAAPKTVAPVTEKMSTVNLSHIIRRPRITEKASMKAEANVYSFEVATEANKKTIAAAVKELYNVTPIKVAIVAIPEKRVIIRNKPGIKKGGKKAYVFLKKGETIEFV
jgi:large subunit ribosomal protein L23